MAAARLYWAYHADIGAFNFFLFHFYREIRARTFMRGPPRKSRAAKVARRFINISASFDTASEPSLGFALTDVSMAPHRAKTRSSRPGRSAVPTKAI